MNRFRVGLLLLLLFLMTALVHGGVLATAAFAAPEILATLPEGSAEILVPAPSTSPATTSIVLGARKLVFHERSGTLHEYHLFNPTFGDEEILGHQTTNRVEGPLFAFEAPVRAGTFRGTITDANVRYVLKEVHGRKGERQDVRFEGTVRTGEVVLQVAKVFSFDTSSDLISVQIKVRNAGTRTIEIGSAVPVAPVIDAATGIATAPAPPPPGIPAGAGLRMRALSGVSQSPVESELALYSAGALTVWPNPGTAKPESVEAHEIAWAGIRDVYYSGIVRFRSPHPFALAHRTDEAPVRADGQKFYPLRADVLFERFSLEPGETRLFDMELFLGPKSLSLLKPLGLDALLEFNFLALIILNLLQFFHGIVQNYGIAIVLLTIAVRGILYPLTARQTRSMQEMQRIQPLLNEVKRQHADNPQRMQEEMMKLYREHGVNPFAGCLPILIQLPIFFALFWALRSTVELRGQSFLWIHDLSRSDPTWILPILVAISMHYQQQQMSMDPEQAAVFRFMPFFMFLISYTLPSGVLIYWATLNTLQIWQQANKPQPAVAGGGPAGGVSSPPALPGGNAGDDGSPSSGPSDVANGGSRPVSSKRKKKS